MLASALSFYAIFTEASGRSLTRLQVATLPLVLLVGLAGAFAGLRRRLLLNAFSRRLALWFALAAVQLAAGRALGLWLGTAIPTQLTLDMLGMATIAATGALFLLPWIGVVAGLQLAGALIAALLPQASALAFSIAASASMLVVVVLLARQRGGTEGT